MNSILILILIPIAWLIVAVLLYVILRKTIVRDSTSLARRVLFTFVSGTILAPGLLSAGHPPPIPFPGAAPIGLIYLSQVLNGPRNEDSFLAAYINLASWFAVTACIGLGELWRLRRQAYRLRDGGAHLLRDIYTGVSVGKPKWVIPALSLCAIVLIFFVLNGPVGEPVRRQGRVIACGPHVHWLTRIATPYCGAQLDDGSIYSFAESDLNVYDHIVTISRFRRRFIGTYDVVQKE